MTRSEHMAWAKQRALDFLKNDTPKSLVDAFGSMASDLSKHKETAGHSGIGLGAMLQLTGHLSTKEQMREFIEGFN